MALITQNVMGAFQGKVGTLSTYNAAAGNIARIRTNATNRGEGASRTDRQQYNRVRWANLVNFYKASKQWMPKAFENKKKGISDYNRFMSVNFNFANVALTKSEAAAGACVVEGFLISQGSLAPIQVQKHGEHWDTNIKLGSLAIGQNTTVAELSLAMIANNNFLREGMQLSCISYQQQMDDLGTPRVICTAYEMIIDTKAVDKIAFDYLPVFCLSAENGVLCTSDHISLGGFAYVLSETVNGRTMVSTQTLIVNNDSMIASFTLPEQYEAAVKSYGISATVFLDADSAEDKNATPQPIYIEKVKGVYGVEMFANMEGVQLSAFFGSDWTFKPTVCMSVEIVPEDVQSAFVYTTPNNGFSADVHSVSGKEITLSTTSEGKGSTNTPCYGIRVVIKGVTYNIPFKTYEGGATEIE